LRSAEGEARARSLIGTNVDHSLTREYVGALPPHPILMSLLVPCARISSTNEILSPEQMSDSLVVATTPREE
jgi:hypothetical protein